MAHELATLGAAARRAAQKGDWAAVLACATEILRRDANSAEGHFLTGLAEKAAQRPLRAAEAFSRALELDPGRYDAAVELADQHVIGRLGAKTGHKLGVRMARGIQICCRGKARGRDPGSP